MRLDSFARSAKSRLSSEFVARHYWAYVYGSFLLVSSVAGQRVTLRFVVTRVSLNTKTKSVTIYLTDVTEGNFYYATQHIMPELASAMFLANRDLDRRVPIKSMATLPLQVLPAQVGILMLESLYDRGPTEHWLMSPQPMRHQMNNIAMATPFYAKFCRHMPPTEWL